MQRKKVIQVPGSNGKGTFHKRTQKKRKKGRDLSHLLYLSLLFPQVPFLSHGTQLQIKLMVNIKAVTSTAQADPHATEKAPSVCHFMNAGVPRGSRLGKGLASLQRGEK